MSIFYEPDLIITQQPIRKDTSNKLVRRSYWTDVRETVGAHHPVVRTDPKTDRKALFLGRRPNAYVLGLRWPRALGAAALAQ